MASYRDHPSWFEFKTILQSKFGVAFDCEPKERWEDVNGHHVHIDEWEAREDETENLRAGAGKGTVVLVHGGGGNGRVLAPFAKGVAEMGWRVLAPDLPGFGITRPAADWRGTYDAWPELVAELCDRQDAPIVLIGASMGGLTAVFSAQTMRRPPLAVVVTTLLDVSDPSTFVRAARWRTLGWLSLLSARLLPWIMDRLSLPLNLVAPLDAMSANKAMAKYFQTDLLLGARWVPLLFWRTAHTRGLKRHDLPCPLFLIHPGADEWTPPAESLKTFDKISTDKKYVLLLAGSHMPLEQDACEGLIEQIGRVLGMADGDPWNLNN